MVSLNPKITALQDNLTNAHKISIVTRFLEQDTGNNG